VLHDVGAHIEEVSLILDRYQRMLRAIVSCDLKRLSEGTERFNVSLAHPPANTLAERFLNDGCEDAGQSVVGLTVDETSLLEPPPLAAYEPWIVPLTVRPNDAASNTADD
jgi:hypothetical protein